MSDLMHIAVGPARNCRDCMDLWMFNEKEMLKSLQQVDTVYKFIQYLIAEELDFSVSNERSVFDGTAYLETLIEGADFSALFVKDVVDNTIVEWEIDAYTMTLVAHALGMAQPCDDGNFSARRCELCGALPGQRYAAHKVYKDFSFDHIDICGNCVLEIANGERPE